MPVDLRFQQPGSPDDGGTPDSQVFLVGEEGRTTAGKRGITDEAGMLLIPQWMAVCLAECGFHPCADSTGGPARKLPSCNQDRWRRPYSQRTPSHKNPGDGASKLNGISKGCEKTGKNEPKTNRKRTQFCPDLTLKTSPEVASPADLGEGDRCFCLFGWRPVGRRCPPKSVFFAKKGLTR